MWVDEVREPLRSVLLVKALHGFILYMDISCKYFMLPRFLE